MTESEAHPLTGDTTTVKQQLVSKPQPPKPTLKPPKRDGCCAPCMWFKESPLERWQFGAFILSAMLPAIWIVLRYELDLTADILTGISAGILALYGANHFHILFGLKAEVDNFAGNNKEFRGQTMQLKTEVNRLHNALDELSEMKHQLTETAKAFEENIAKFKKVQDVLHQLSDDNIEGVRKLKEMSIVVQTSIKDELQEHHRSILTRVVDSLGLVDKSSLTKQEYEKFVQTLPISFQNRFKDMNKSWTEIAGPDHRMDVQEFSDLCDKFAEDESFYFFEQCS